MSFDTSGRTVGLYPVSLGAAGVPLIQSRLLPLRGVQRGIGERRTVRGQGWPSCSPKASDSHCVNARPTTTCLSSWPGPRLRKIATQGMSRTVGAHLGATRSRDIAVAAGSAPTKASTLARRRRANGLSLEERCTISEDRRRSYAQDAHNPARRLRSAKPSGSATGCKDPGFPRASVENWVP